MVHCRTWLVIKSGTLQLKRWLWCFIKKHKFYRRAPKNFPSLLSLKKPIPVNAAKSMVGNTFTLQKSHFNIAQPTLAVEMVSCLLGCFKQLCFTKRFIVLNEFLTHKLHDNITAACCAKRCCRSHHPSYLKLTWFKRELPLKCHEYDLWWSYTLKYHSDDSFNITLSICRNLITKNHNCSESKRAAANFQST